MYHPSQAARELAEFPALMTEAVWNAERPALILSHSQSSDFLWRHLEICLAENLLCCTDLPVLTEAAALGRLLNEGGCSIRSLAKRFGRRKSYVKDRVRVLNMSMDLKWMLAIRPNSLAQALLISKAVKLAADATARRGDGGSLEMRTMEERLVQQVLDGSSVDDLREQIDGEIALFQGGTPCRGCQ